jgi:hypothetical protein
MSDEAEFFSNVKQKQDESCPQGMSVVEWKRLKEAHETQRHLTRGESVRVPVEHNEQLATLFSRGDLVKASELEAKLKSEAEVRRVFEQAVEDRRRDSRHEAPRPTTINTTPIWTRDRIEE